MATKSIVFFLVFSFAIFSHSESTVHQYFKSIEDDDSRQYLNDGLVFLFKNYGKPSNPVNKVYIKRSIKCRNPELLSSPDIRDWKLFLAELKSFKSEKRFSIITKDLPPLSNSLEWNEKAQIINSLNKLILDEKFHENDEIKLLVKSKEQKKWRGDGFFGCFSEDFKRLNRSIISSLFSKSVIPFKKLRGVREGRQSCEILDKESGAYVIYAKHEPGTEKFYAELGHEMFHILDAECHDWYVEGLASVFSEEFALSKGKSWDVWRENFRKDKFDEPYAASYTMMKAISDLRKGIFKDFMRFSTSSAGKRKFLDINGFYQQLHGSDKTIVKSVLKRFSETLIKHKKNNFFLIKN